MASPKAAADGGATLAGAVLAALAVSLVDGVEAAEAVSTLGLDVDGVELGVGSRLEEVVLGVLALIAFLDGVLTGLAGCAGGGDALGAFATLLPASATIAGLSLAAVAVPTSPGGVSDAVVRGCTVAG